MAAQPSMSPSSCQLWPTGANRARMPLPAGRRLALLPCQRRIRRMTAGLVRKLTAYTVAQLNGKLVCELWGSHLLPYAQVGAAAAEGQQLFTGKHLGAMSAILPAVLQTLTRMATSLPRRGKQLRRKSCRPTALPRLSARSAEPAQVRKGINQAFSALSPLWAACLAHWQPLSTSLAKAR